MTAFPDDILNTDQAMNPEDCIDPLELQRLAEGRLPAEERDALLQWAEDHPQLWRYVALAYVEEQSLRHTLLDADELSPVSQRPLLKRAARPLGWVTAACLCTLAAGWAGASYGRNAAVAEMPPLPEPETYVLWTTAKPVERRSAIEDALVRVSRPVLDEKLRRSLLEAGVVAEERPTIYLVDGPGGQSIPVAERELIFKPVSVPTTDTAPKTEGTQE